LGKKEGGPENRHARGGTANGEGWGQLAKKTLKLFGKNGPRSAHAQKQKKKGCRRSKKIMVGLEDQRKLVQRKGKSNEAGAREDEDRNPSSLLNNQ